MKIKNNLPLILLFCLYGILLALNMRAYAGGSDSSGYSNIARLIASGKLHEKQRIVEGISAPEISKYAYIPLGFAPSSNEEMIPTYPFGLPIIVALTSFVTGLAAAPHIVMWLHAIGSLILIYNFAFLLNLEKLLAVIATVLLAINPLFVSYSTQLMSDMPSLFWCGLAIFAALKTQEKVNWAIIAGAAVGVAVMIRPVNILIFIPLLIALGKNWRSLIYCGLAGLPFAATLLILNHVLYGKFITTGYGDFSEFFSPEFIPLSIKSYARYLILELTPFLLLGVGIFMPKIWRQNQRVVVVITAWIASFSIFYSCYYFTHETWGYMRFLLPIFPAIILAMILTAQNIHESFPQFRRVILIFFLTFSFSWQASVLERLPVITDQDESYFKSINLVKDILPENSIFVAIQTSGALLNYTNFPIIRYDAMDRKDLEKIDEVAKKARRPIYAMLYPFEVKEVLEKFPGDWKKIRETDNQISIWRRDDEE